MAEAFDGTINCRYACRPRERVRTDREGSNATVTAQTTVSQGPGAFVPSQDDSGAADTRRVPSQRREHSILGIGASLQVTGFVFAVNLNTHSFNGIGGTPL